MDLNPIPLQKMRPLLYQEVCLRDSQINPLDEKKLIIWLKLKLDQMLSQVIEKFPQNLKVPILRLKIDHADYEVISMHKIT